MRTRNGLPFVCTRYMRLILSGILARVQRDQKVTICHFVWMSNHLHMVIVVKDSFECTKFYCEVQKQITDAVKGLLGLRYLSLWLKNGTSVIRYGDLEGCIERIAYIYANPAKAHLVDSIKSYPGFSSWDGFNQNLSSLKASYKEECPWIRTPMITELVVKSVSPAQDQHITNRLKSAAKVTHELVIEPNAWMKVFGIETDEEIAEVNSQIHERLKSFEDLAREDRIKRGFKVKGATKLAQEYLTLDYMTKSTSRKIFAYAFNPKLRTQMIHEYKYLCELCYECYQRWKLGDYKVDWPLGVFLPAMPPRANCLAGFT